MPIQYPVISHNSILAYYNGLLTCKDLDITCRDSLSETFVRFSIMRVNTTPKGMHGTTRSNYRTRATRINLLP
jgi:hypothetical protein